jgi:mevalonate kinase
MATASAPGKIILFGEHAVVYGRPALAVPVTQVHADVNIAASSRAGIWIDAPDIGLRAELNTLPPDHPIASVIHRFFNNPGSSSEPGGTAGSTGLEIRITSSIPVASGLGSGAAVSVALIRALASTLDRSASDEEVNRMAYEIEKIHHGTPSGIDNTVITYARPVYFVRGRPVETFTVARRFTLVIGDTGISAPTRESVADVRRLWESDKIGWEDVFDEVGRIAETAKERLENGRPEALGELMNANHALLQKMTVSSPELDELVEAAREAGASGAKMSGGGRGGNMIALAGLETASAISAALKEAGARNTIITTVGS